ncbi:MAG: hypothetical protein JJ896_12290 [Rhodothermales bacterium]|nr:hypothetical protein [Rhodothermales bacterium]MBO6780424.1 hypothetical protein [Rhodothermales bacterium]
MLRTLWKEALALPRDAGTLRRFGLVVGGVFLAIAVFLMWRSDWVPGTAATVLIAVGTPLVMLGTLLPGALRTVYPAWMLIALVLGTIMTRVLLTLVFLLVVTPIALMLRLAGKDPMNRRPDPGMRTYWITRDADSNDPARMEKLY